MAAAVRELSSPEGIDVKHHDEMFPITCPDVEWITKLGAERDWAILTKDRFSKNDAERLALRETGLLVFIFTKQWSQHTRWDVAYSLVRWWPRIIGAASLLSNGAYSVPFKLSGKGKFEQIQL